MRNRSFLFALLLPLFVAVPVAADEDSGGWSGNVTMASDYSFRGWSQTMRHIAIQGGFDLEFDSGFAIGTWASNVNFGDGTSQELDLYASYSMSLSDTTSLSISAIQFEYPGEGENLDYQEIQASLDINSISIGFAFSPAYLAVDDATLTYISAGYSGDLGEVGSFDLSLGLSAVDQDDFFGDDADSYVDYLVGVSVPAGGLDLGVQLVGTTLDDDNPDTEPRLILSIGKSL